MARIFLTGGAGFIGSRLAHRLNDDGHAVTVFDNFHSQVHSQPEATVRSLIEKGISVRVGDIREPDTLASALEASRPETVIHLAAETGTGQSSDFPVRYCETNVIGTARLVEAIRKVGDCVRRVLLAGSRAVYGEGACVDSDGNLAVAMPRVDADMRAGIFDLKDRHGRRLTPVPTSSTWATAPISIYASTKLMQEHIIQQAFWGTDVAVGVMRLQNVYGPGQSLTNPYTGVLSIFAKQLLDGADLNIYEDGRITRDFVFVDDVVSAFTRLAIVEPCPAAILDIGTGVGVTILDVALEMVNILRSNADRIRVSSDFRAGDIRHAVADITQACNVLSWQPAVNLRSGIEALLAWAQEQHWRTRPSEKCSNCADEHVGHGPSSVKRA